MRTGALHPPRERGLTGLGPSPGPSIGRILAGPLLLISLALAGCSKDLGPPIAPERLNLTPVAGADGELIQLDYEPKLVETLQIPEALEPWSVEGPGTVEIVEPGSSAGADGPRLLRADIEARTRLHIPLEAGQRFNRVQVYVDPQRGTGKRLQVVAVARGKALATSAVEYTEKAGVVTLDLPALDGFDPVVTKLSLHVFSQPGFADIGAIQLIQVPGRAWLPDPLLGARHIELDGQSRAAVGLSSLVPLGARTVIPKGARLTFSYGGHRRLQRGDSQGKSVLSVVVEDRDRSVAEFSFPLGKHAASRWEHVDVSLDSVSGDDLFVRFTLLTPGAELGQAPDQAAEETLGIAEACVYRPQENPRTVLLVTSDTHRADNIGLAANNVGVETPILDALARRGILFEEAYSATNITNPSHVAMLTGTHPRDTGIIDNSTRLSDAAPTLAEAFAGAGFATWAATSAVHLRPDISGLGQGFDRFTAPAQPQRPAPETLKLLEDWLDEREGQPLFVWLHVFDVHGPYEPPEPFKSNKWPADRDPFDPALPDPGIPVKALAKHRLAGLRDVSYPYAMYQAEVEYLDSELERVFDHRRLRDAVIGLTGDHGESFGGHGIYFTHAGVYPDTVHVPLVLAFPGGPQDTKSLVHVTNIDLARTLLDLSGLAKADFPGTNLMRAVETPDDYAKPIFTLGDRRQMASLTEDGWHMVVSLLSHQRHEFTRRRERHETELFHIAVDPAAEVDLVEQEPERAASMRAKLRAWLADPHDTGWGISETISADTLEALEALGYVGGDDEDDPRTSSEIDFRDDCTCVWCSRFTTEN